MSLTIPAFNVPEPHRLTVRPSVCPSTKWTLKECRTLTATVLGLDRSLKSSLSHQTTESFRNDRAAARAGFKCSAERLSGAG